MRRSVLLTGLALLATACQPDGGNTVLPTDVFETSVAETSEPGTNPNATGFSFDAASSDAGIASGIESSLGGQTTADAKMGPIVSATASLQGGINPVVSETGQVSLSMDGLGTTYGSGSIQVRKPAGATVRGAYFMAASTGYSSATISNTQVTLNGTAIAWQLHQASSIYSHNYFSDVTAVVKSTIDAAPAGIVNLTVTEASSYSIDGTILAVIFDDPNQTTDNTVALLFGGQKTAGDVFFLGLENPVDRSDPGLQIDMSLGISFGYQGGSQYSIVDVNGQRLTTSAGGRDDGNSGNGSLITVGGIGDSNNNPSPYAPPYTHRSDDELYNLVPFLPDGSQVVQINTRNPSNDDNIFFAGFFLTVPAEVVTEEPVANAGPDQEVEVDGPLPFAQVTVDGSGSFDPDGTIVSYAWSIDGDPFPIGGPSLTFLFDVGVHTVTLVVTDNDGLTDADEAIITVNPPADATPPVITYALSGPVGNNGWYVGPVSVAWTVTDPESEVISSTCTPMTAGSDGSGQTFTCSATSLGGTAVATTEEFSIDATAPEVSYSSYGATYDVTDFVNITCSASDATSGIATAVCADITGDAWGFGPGTHTYSASAEDNAGNTNSDETSFTVAASFDGLCSMVEQWVSHKGVANSLCVKLAAAERAESRNSTNARDGSLSAFVNEVEAQSGKKVPADKASILIAFAEAMMN